MFFFIILISFYLFILVSLGVMIPRIHSYHMCVHVWERNVILLESCGGQGELSVIWGSKSGLIVRKLDHLDPMWGIRSSKLQKGLCKNCEMCEIQVGAFRISCSKLSSKLSSFSGLILLKARMVSSPAPRDTQSL